MGERSIDLESISLKSALKRMMAEADIDSLAIVARNIEINETTFRSAINNDSLRLKDFLKAAKFLGFKVRVVEEEQK